MKKAKKKLNVSTHILVDFDSKDVSESLREKLYDNALYDYEDKILKEDIFGEVDGLRERADEQGVEFTTGEELELDGISRIMNIKKGAYFRIIF